ADPAPVSTRCAVGEVADADGVDRHQGRKLAMSMFDTMNISGSALSAERLRAEVTSANMANAETTHTDSGGPYVRKEVVFTTRNGSPFRTVFAGLGRFSQPASGSVQISQVVDDPTQALWRHESRSPDAAAAADAGGR